MQLRRSILLAIMIILFVYFEIHSCSEDRPVGPVDPIVEDPGIICDAGHVFFLDRDHGWVIGSLGTLIRTTDGGVTWEGTVIEGMRLTDVNFIDEEKGWVVGREGKIYRTFDGGSSWERAIFSGYPQYTDFYQVRFVSDTLGYILAYDGVFRTIDGGMLWENNWLSVIPNKGAWDMSLVDINTVYLLGSHWTDTDPRLIYITEDSGENWQSVEGSEASVLRGVMTISFVSSNTGWAGGGIVMKTSDGGGSWTTQLGEATVRKFFFLSEEHGFAVGGRRIMRTKDGGEMWEDVSPVDDRIVNIRDVYFLDDLTGWVVGKGLEENVGSKVFRHSIILNTEDGGDTWCITDFSFDYTGFVSTESDS